MFPPQITMENDCFEKENEIYVNCQMTPDIITQQPITSQVLNKPVLDEPITVGKPGSDSSKDTESRRTWELSDKIYSLDGEQNRRDWTSGLFFSLNGRPHKIKLQDKCATAVHDCCCMSCMMCSIAKRLGDPAFLPFLPCTGTAVRFKVRILGGITGTIGNDCLVTSFCWPCAVCQMHREMDDIGI